MRIRFKIENKSSLPTKCSLMNDSSIVITSADKGGGQVVIMDRLEYKKSYDEVVNGT